MSTVGVSSIGASAPAAGSPIRQKSQTWDEKHPPIHDPFAGAKLLRFELSEQTYNEKMVGLALNELCFVVHARTGYWTCVPLTASPVPGTTSQKELTIAIEMGDVARYVTLNLTQFCSSSSRRDAVDVNSADDSRVLRQLKDYAGKVMSQLYRQSLQRIVK